MKVLFEMSERKRTVIVGAGISGCLLALHLAKKGFEVEVYEKRKFEKYNSKRARICISEKELHYLSKLDLYNHFTEIFYPIQGFRETVIASHTKFTALNKFSLFIGDKEEFCDCLIDECKKTTRVKFHFDHNLQIVNLNERILTFVSNDSIINVEYFYLFGCDGKQSIIREELKNNGFVVSQNSDFTFHIKRIYVQVKDLITDLDPNYIHTWTYKNDLLVALPDKFKGFEFYIYTNEKEFPTSDNGILKPLFSIVNKKAVQYELTNTSTYTTKEVIDFSILNSNKVLLWGDASKSISNFHDLNIDKCVEGIRKFISLLIQTDYKLDNAIFSYSKLEIENLKRPTSNTKSVYQ
jgi:kynurenine 3-monooxygenase